MVKQASLTAELESLLGRDAVLPEPPLFAVDGLVPRAALAPGSVEEVAAAMGFAHERGLAVIPWGSGSLMQIGNVPQRYDIALGLSRLDRVLEHEPADLTATVQAGITLGDLQQQLGQGGQFLPLDPPAGHRATIGGILAANASGPSRHAYGTARDITIGMRVVTADGRITRAGGRVVKNVAGYDLCKLYIGCLGTLGVIVEATFKLAPLPKAERIVVASFAAPPAACAFAAELQRRGLSMRALQLLNPVAASATGLSREGGYALIVDLAGSTEAVERSRREIGGLAREAGAQLRDVDSRTPVWPEGTELLCKAVVLPTRIPALIEAGEALPGSPRIIAQPTVGVVHASWAGAADAENVVSALQSATAGLGGTLVVEACPPELKPRLDVFGEPPPAFDLMRRVKQQFDPKGVLSPGRYVGRL